MVFSTFEFLFIFFPMTILIYYIVPVKLRNGILFALSLLFYAWGEPRYIFIMLFSTVFDYANGRMLERFDRNERIRKLILLCSLTVNLGLLCFFKYTDFAIETANALFSTSISALQLALPIGISFYTFQTLSYTIDVYRRKVSVQHNLIDFGMYVCLFPQLIAGPIVRYADIQMQIKNRTTSTELMWQGLLRFAAGLGKKVLLANQIGALWEEISALSQPAALSAWLGAFAYAFLIYFDFSGYSDMAIGLGLMFGFHFPENFDHPYQSESVTEFWRRWHTTLGSWFREYLYIPLGGNRKGPLRQLFHMLAVWFCTGLWHGAGWNFILWGLYYFLLLACEKSFLLKVLQKLPHFFRHAYTMVGVLLGWVIFACDDAAVLREYFGALSGFNGLASSMSIYYLTTYAVLFFILAVGSTTLPARIWQGCIRRFGLSGQWVLCLQAIFLFAVVCVSVAFLAADSYNPFLYFRF